MHIVKRALFSFVTFLIVTGSLHGQVRSLAGQWRFKLDSADVGLSERWFDSILPDQLELPGSSEQRGFGIKNLVRDKDRLTRVIKYEGKAWYQLVIDVDPSWKGRRVELYLERCHLESAAWLDGKPYGIQNSLSASHVYDLGMISTGIHTLTICIDNTYKIPIGKWGFAITEDTQGNWNGIIGRIELRATDPVWIKNVQVYADHLQVKIGNITGRSQAASLNQQQVNIPALGTIIDLPFHSGKAAWDEFSPNLQTLTLQLKAGNFTDTATVSYGIRELTTKNGQFVLNGRPILVRGPVNECIYPLTGYPPMDKSSWLHVLNICRSYGFNYMRFNSWCPPDAAFQAADELGMFLQVELPFWSMEAPAFGEHPLRDQFLVDELYAILEQYGNHPSFTFMAMGNESPGPSDILVNKGRAMDTRMLYRCQDGDTITKGDYAEKGTEIGQRGIKGPRTNWNRWNLTDDSITSHYKTLNLPTLAHEVGQWASYPDFDQLIKFSGTLKPYNYERFQQSLAAHNMAAQGKAFAKASGQFAVSLYKDEIEGCLRTFPHGGFQIVEARDFPGEGGAMIGWLDAFWDSKGLITPGDFRRFCAPTVCLLEMPKRIYTNAESLIATAEIAHYGPQTISSGVSWKIENTNAKVLYSGSMPVREIVTGKMSRLGEINVSFEKIVVATRLVVTLAAAGTSNSWNIWVYPEKQSLTEKEITVSYAFDDDTRKVLSSGGNVILFSSPKQGLFEIKPAFGLCFGWIPEVDSAGHDARQFPPVQKGQSAIPGTFMPAFWSMRLFNQIGTMGILCDPKHPALAGFPTESRSDWQWADILGRYTAKLSYETATDLTPHDWGDVNDRSKAVILNETPAGYRPIVQVIDNYERNYKLGLIFETRVGKGKLLICALDLDTDAEKRPAARQLKSSLLQYAAGKQFNPAYELPVEFLERILTY